MQNPQIKKGRIKSNRTEIIKTISKIICLNPSCKSSRIFQFQISKKQSIIHEDHITCKNWLYDIEELRYKFSGKNLEELNMESFSIDYFVNTIDSIFMAQCLNDNDQQTTLLKYYDQLQKKIKEYISQNFYKTQNEIRQHMKINTNVANQIFKFCENNTPLNEKQLESMYNKKLKEPLKKMKEIGYLSFSNKISLTIRLIRSQTISSRLIFQYGAEKLPQNQKTEQLHRYSSLASRIRSKILTLSKSINKFKRYKTSIQLVYNTNNPKMRYLLLASSAKNSQNRLQRKLNKGNNNQELKQYIISASGQELQKYGTP